MAPLVGLPLLRKGWAAGLPPFGAPVAFGVVNNRRAASIARRSTSAASDVADAGRRVASRSAAVPGGAGFFMADETTPEGAGGSPETDGIDYPRYFQALGRFVAMFSAVESVVQTLFWQMTGVDERVAPAVFSGVRMDAAQGLIKRVLEVRTFPKLDRAELDAVLSQLTTITKVRNDILHHGAYPRGSRGFVTSNRIVAFTPDRLRETSASPEVLDALHADLNRMAILLGGAFLAVRGLELTDGMAATLEEARRDAWRYKPDAPSRNDPPRPPKPPRR